MPLEFDSRKYANASAHQKEWGQRLISELNLKGNEAILDLGSGDGALTARLAELVPEGKVVGIDRIAVMAGLNLANEAIQSGSVISSNSTGVRLRELNTRIEDALASYRQTEMN